MSQMVLKVTHANKTFQSHERKTIALNDVSFSVNTGESIALLGASGSGKSTLIRAICGLETLDSSSESIWVDGENIQSNGKLSSNIRKIRSSIGVIFQQFNLVNQLDVITNVLIGLGSRKNMIQLLAKNFSSDEKALALDALEKVGMVDYAYQRASTLSGGQQQRVAIARALIKGSKILLADEPVASLDPESARKVMELMVGLSQQYGLTFITSLHQVHIAKKCCDRTIALNKGNLVLDGKTADLTKESLARLYGSQLGDIEMGIEEETPPAVVRPTLVLVN
jgi:phosphonate transport system ATP-binding protein